MDSQHCKMHLKAVSQDVILFLFFAMVVNSITVWMKGSGLSGVARGTKKWQFRLLRRLGQNRRTAASADTLLLVEIYHR